MMKALNDEEIKRMLDEQLKEDGKSPLTGNDEDAALYRLLFTALADEPAELQNAGLAESVIQQIKINGQKTEALRYKMIIVAVLMAGIVSAYFAIGYVSPASLLAVLSFIYLYKWIFVFIALCMAAIETADKSLIKRKIAIIH
jgi:hypothetical protein